jgi:hypothetical protein
LALGAARHVIEQQWPFDDMPLNNVRSPPWHPSRHGISDGLTLKYKGTKNANETATIGTHLLDDFRTDGLTLKYKGTENANETATIGAHLLDDFRTDGLTLKYKCTENANEIATIALTYLMTSAPSIGA